MSIPKPQQILIADDDPVASRVLSSVLNAAGFQCSVAVDAMQATMLAMRTPFDAILLDIGMPGGTGFQVIERLKATAKTRRVPIIVITGSTDPLLPGRVLGMGVDKFFAKPVAPDELREALERLLAPPIHDPAES